MEHKHKKPQILLLSTGNAARSQMAEGFLRALGSQHFDVMSAGVKPGPLNPLATEVMKEKGIDISKYESKDVAQCIKQCFSYVITLSDTAKERSPIFPFTTHLIHWGIKARCRRGTPQPGNRSLPPRPRRNRSQDQTIPLRHRQGQGQPTHLI